MIYLINPINRNKWWVECWGSRFHHNILWWFVLLRPCQHPCRILQLYNRVKESRLSIWKLFGNRSDNLTGSSLDSISLTILWYIAGYANFYPDKASNTLYTTSMSGINYLVAIYPVITGVSPSHGSLAGGTTITITGNGFNNVTNALRVVVGGVKCTVLSATVDTIKCITGNMADRLLLSLQILFEWLILQAKSPKTRL